MFGFGLMNLVLYVVVSGDCVPIAYLALSRMVRVYITPILFYSEVIHCQNSNELCSVFKEIKNDTE